MAGGTGPLPSKPAAPSAPVQLEEPPLPKVMLSLELDGFVPRIPALSEREVSEALTGLKRWEDQHHLRIEKVGVDNIWLPWLRSLAKNKAIVGAVAEAFGTRSVYLYGTVLFPLKAGPPLVGPGRDKETAWRTDKEVGFARLHPVDRRHCVTALVALTPCDRLTGCLRVRPTSAGAGPTTSDAEVDLELRPGDFTLLGPCTPHAIWPGAPGGGHACCIALRYVRASVRDRKSKKYGRDCAVLVSGEDTTGRPVDTGLHSEAAVAENATKAAVEEPPYRRLLSSSSASVASTASVALPSCNASSGAPSPAVSPKVSPRSLLPPPRQRGAGFTGADWEPPPPSPPRSLASSPRGDPEAPPGEPAPAAPCSSARSSLVGGGGSAGGVGSGGMARPRAAGPKMRAAAKASNNMRPQSSRLATVTGRASLDHREAETAADGAPPPPSSAVTPGLERITALRSRLEKSLRSAEDDLTAELQQLDKRIAINHRRTSRGAPSEPCGEEGVAC